MEVDGWEGDGARRSGLGAVGGWEVVLQGGVELFADDLVVALNDDVAILAHSSSLHLRDTASSRRHSGPGVAAGGPGLRLRAAVARAPPCGGRGRDDGAYGGLAQPDRRCAVPALGGGAGAESPSHPSGCETDSYSRESRRR
jgi:hypothetical protein